MGSNTSKCIGSNSKSSFPATITFVKSSGKTEKENNEETKSVHKIIEFRKKELEPIPIKVEKDVENELANLKQQIIQIQEEQYLLNDAPVESFVDVKSNLIAKHLQSSFSPNTDDEFDLSPMPAIKLIGSPCNDPSVRFMIHQLFHACSHGNLFLIQSYFEDEDLNARQTFRHTINIRYPCNNPLYQSHLVRQPLDNESEKARNQLLSQSVLELNLLQYCVLLNQCEILNYLLKFSDDYDPNGINPLYGYNALHFSVLFDRLQVLEQLCYQSRINVHEKGSDGKDVLQIAIQLKNYHAVECILRIKPTYDVKQRDFEGNTALHYLALSPDENIIQLVLNFVEGKYFSSFHFSNSSSPRLLSDNYSLGTFAKYQLNEFMQMDSNYLLRKKKLIYEMKNNKGETAFSLYEKEISHIIQESDSEIISEELQKLQKCQEILVKASSYPFLFQETITSFGYQSENSPSVSSQRSSYRYSGNKARSYSYADSNLTSEHWRTVNTYQTSENSSYNDNNSIKDFPYSIACSYSQKNEEFLKFIQQEER